MNRHYFDYAASTPVDPAVIRAMAPFWADKFGNPGSLHSFGQEASAAVFEARDMIAKSLGCHYSEIVFTGSATEANNLAIRGVLRGIMNNESGIKNGEKSIIHNSKFIIPKVIVSAIEHDSILGTCRELEKDGVEVVYLPVSKNGIVDLKKLESALDERTILVSIMYANNEVGTIQPIFEISKIIKDFKNRKIKGQNLNFKEKSNQPTNQLTNYPLMHTDAVQAFNYLDCNVNNLGTDLMTLSSQKIYGPKGIGLLYVRRNPNYKNQILKFELENLNLSALAPIITGGGQERGFRAGTENVPGIVGFAKAVELISSPSSANTSAGRESENKRLRKLQEYFLKQVKKINSKIELNGDAKNRLPNNINLHIPAKDSRGSAQDLVIALDMAGFAVSPGSACSARVCSPSHVLKALGYSDEKSMSGLRITFGRQTTKADVDGLLKNIRKIL